MMMTKANILSLVCLFIIKYLIQIDLQKQLNPKQSWPTGRRGQFTDKGAVSQLEMSLLSLIMLSTVLLLTVVWVIYTSDCMFWSSVELLIFIRGCRVEPCFIKLDKHLVYLSFTQDYCMIFLTTIVIVSGLDKVIFIR